MRATNNAQNVKGTRHQNDDNDDNDDRLQKCIQFYLPQNCSAHRGIPWENYLKVHIFS